MTRRLRFCLAIVMGLLAAPRLGWTAEAEPLMFGVLPYLTARQIVETYRPVADALEIQLKRRVLLYTARDYKTFVTRTRRGEYDILLTPPHLAWLAQHEAGYRPLLQYAQPIRGLLVVKSDSPFYSVEALRGHTIATADPLATAILATEAQLADRGLQRTIDYHITDAATHINAAMQVINGRAGGAMLAQQPYNMMRPELRRQLRVLSVSAPLPGRMYLTHSRLPRAEAEALRVALLNFSASPSMQAVRHRIDHGDIQAVEGNALRPIPAYALQVQESLRQTP